jgi:hypothetical protein
MPKKKAGAKKNYSDEIMRIKRLKVVTDVLEKGDVENAFLTTASKDSDAASDTTAEQMLEELNITKGRNKEVHVLDELLTKGSKKERTPKKAKSQTRGKRR